MHALADKMMAPRSRLTAVTVLPPAHPKVVAAVKPEQWSALGAAQLEAGALAEELKVVGEKTGSRHRSLPVCVEAYGALPHSIRGNNCPRLQR